MKNIETIYLDMDNVLTDFHPHYKNSFGLDWRDIHHVSDRWEPLNENPNWFETIPLRDDALLLYNYTKSLGVTVKILTATGWKYNEVREAKRNWCEKHLPDMPIGNILMAKEGKDKYLFARGPQCILIDDMERNIKGWRDAGGRGIIHTSTDQTILELKEMF